MACDYSDISMTELDQVLRRRIRAAPVRGADRRYVRSWLARRIQHDKRDVARATLPLLHVGQVADHEDDPDRSAVEHTLNPVKVRLLAIVRAGYHHAHT